MFENPDKINHLNLISINILNDWPLSVRTYNALKTEDIIFLGDLLSYEEKSLLKLRNFGKKSLSEIQELLLKFNIDKENIQYDMSDWSEIREDLIKKNKESEKIKIETRNTLGGLNKSIFKDFKKFKENFYNIKTLKITNDFDVKKLEELIIKDIEYLISLLTERMRVFFLGRYGFKENYKTLDELGKKYGITRERVRQLEKILNLSLARIGIIEKQTLINYFNQYDYVSFHKLFPRLDEMFTDTARGTEEITRDKLTVFMEFYCGVKAEYFKTPERELWNFNEDKLKEIFTLIPSGHDKENFIEIIKDNYGYNNFVARSSIEFMENKKLIKIVNNKIYPLKMLKNLEVTHILVSYPEGLHWRKISEIGNNSFTNNKWDLNRIVGDSSLNMLTNQSIYLSERGTYKLFRYCLDIKNKNEIIDFFINYLQENNLEQSSMEPAFKEMTNLSQFKNLNFYDARAIIKKFGAEFGLFHKGTSGTNTISLNKNIKVISLKEKIKDIITNASDEIHLQDIIKKLQKTNEDIPVDHHLNDLVDKFIIFKTSPGTYLSFEKAQNLYDEKEIINELEMLLENYEFVTTSFVREKLNEKLLYNFSNYFYDSMIKKIILDKPFFYSTNYLSSKSPKTSNLEHYVKNNYNWTLSSNENYKILSYKIGMTKRNFANIIYKPEFKYNNKVSDQE